jgi:hypothetical protein
MSGPLKFCIVLEAPKAAAGDVHTVDVSATEVARNTPTQLESLIGMRVLRAINALVEGNARG